MLFHAYVFVFVFLPITLGGVYAIGRWSERRNALTWLLGASLLFYAFGNPAHAPMLLVSALFNYGMGLAVSGDGSSSLRKALLALAIVADLLLLGAFKYVGFEGVAWPVALSFVTFQQIAYLVDNYRDGTDEHDFIDYCLFITFFPQLLAGPIVRHRELHPQLGRLGAFDLDNLSVGGTMFLIGLAKKVLVADTLGTWSDQAFGHVVAGGEASFALSWIGALSFTLQLYYDFSGYSDMALGLARMVGVQLPLNFDAPYKSADIADFWRRWHITLHRFACDYIYVPLGGRRVGPARAALNLVVAMCLLGVWHGATLGYAAFGLLHGLYLVMHRVWQTVAPRLGLPRDRSTPGWTALNRLVTFQAIVWSFVLFRANDLDATRRILLALYGGNGVGFGAPFDLVWPLVVIGVLLVWVNFGPHTQQVLRHHQPCLDAEALAPDWTPPHPWLDAVWRPTRRNAMALAVVTVASVLTMSRVVDFLYLRF